MIALLTPLTNENRFALIYGAMKYNKLTVMLFFCAFAAFRTKPVKLKIVSQNGKTGFLFQLFRKP